MGAGKYIDRKETGVKLLQYLFPDKDMGAYELAFNDGLRMAIKIVNCAPAADVKPENHGEWMAIPTDIFVVCSECNAMLVGKGTPYCPNCGAKMNGKG